MTATHGGLSAAPAPAESSLGPEELSCCGVGRNPARNPPPPICPGRQQQLDSAPFPLGKVKAENLRGLIFLPLPSLQSAGHKATAATCSPDDLHSTPRPPENSQQLQSTKRGQRRHGDGSVSPVEHLGRLPACSLESEVGATKSLPLPMTTLRNSDQFW